MRYLFLLVPLLFAAALPAQAEVEQYIFDKKGQHAFVQFRIQHLGYSWLYGQFNDFDGKFSYDTDNPANSTVEVTINTASVDTNHAERDKHLRDDDFLEVDKYPTAKFVSKRVEPAGEGKAKVIGDLTLHGVTKEIVLDMHQVGAGPDPWGGYRRGFEGSAKFKLADFNIKKDLGPASQTVELILSVEGIRQ